jgi:hypothetical protein
MLRTKKKIIFCIFNLILSILIHDYYYIKIYCNSLKIIFFKIIFKDFKKYDFIENNIQQFLIHLYELKHLYV